MPAPPLREDRLRGHDNISFNFPIATQSPREGKREGPFLEARVAEA